MTDTGGSSELLQAGIVQKAFTRLVEQYPNLQSTGLLRNYIVASAESVTQYLSNTTKDTSYPLDRFSNGNAMMDLSRTADHSNVSIALTALRKSLDLQPRNANRGLWYYIYPYWSYLDGMFSYAPFYALYTRELEPGNSSAVLADIHLQIDLLWQRCRIESSGLLVHGYDFSKTALWSNPETGASPHVWGRSLGWYAMALVDTLELLLPSKESMNEQDDLQCKIISLLAAIINVVDPLSGAWWQVMDQPAAPGNYIESSASAMFVYALLRAERLRHLASNNCGSDLLAPVHPASEIALRAYDYIVDNFVVVHSNGTLGYNGTVSVCSLNSTASYDYYVKQPILYNSVLGSASFVLASLEVEHFKASEKW